MKMKNILLDLFVFIIGFLFGGRLIYVVFRMQWNLAEKWQQLPIVTLVVCLLLLILTMLAWQNKEETEEEWVERMNRKIQELPESFRGPVIKILNWLVKEETR